MSQTIDEDLLAILVCPETKQPLVLASDDQVEQIRSAVKDKSLSNRGGRTIVQDIDGALVRKDGRVAYLVIEGIPDLIVDEGILLQNL